MPTYRPMVATAKAAAVLACAGLSTPADAQSGVPAPPALAAKPSITPLASTVYTALALKRCKRLGTGKDGGRWGCSGPKGHEVQFAEGDLRQFLAYGAKAREQRSASQTLGPFNSIFKDDTDRATIQWRGTVAAGRFVPFATIVRYYTDTGDDGSGKRQRSQVLVVTKLGAADGSEACHVAYIDAVANKDANVLATRTADALARGFDCRKEPVVAGAKGAVPPVLPTRT